jgi:hypothetical protein
VSAEAFRSKLETHFTLCGLIRVHGHLSLKYPQLCSQDTAIVLMASDAMKEHLPPIQGVVESPIFSEDEEGRLVVLDQGYHETKGGLLVTKNRKINTEIPLEQATESLLGLYQDYSFLTPSDRSRSIAGIISPALRLGGLLKADFPLEMCEADQSQAGKSHRTKLISTIYGETPYVVGNKDKRGVGSMDEALSGALMSGKSFISLENIRGVTDSQLLEMAIRGVGTVPARRAYSRTIEVKTDHIVWMGTSNRAQTTPDLANRSVITRIRKQPEDYKFKVYEEGSLLEHVSRNRDYYLSCVFTVVREWHRQGKPRTKDTRHDFREWCQSMDWIVQNLFKLPPLLDGHRSEQLRLSSPALSLLRDVALVIQKEDLCGVEINASYIAQLCDAEGVEIPGCRPEMEPDAKSRKIGTLLGPLFKGSGSVEVEGFQITRTDQKVYKEKKQQFVPTKMYTFQRIGDPVIRPAQESTQTTFAVMDRNREPDIDFAEAS